jgi:DNA-binding IclR family transcriptional regulator
MQNSRSSNKNESDRSGLSRGLDVLELLSGRRDGLGLGVIARELEMSKSGTHGVLATLTRHGFVERLPGGIYRLGMQAWHVGNGVPSADLARVATPLMEQLVRNVGEGAILGVLAGFDVIYLRLVEGSQAVRVHAQVNDRIPANCTSTGLALLAFQAPGYLDAVMPSKLTQVTPATIADGEGLRRELKRVQARGYAINLGGWRADVGGIAAPVLNDDGIAFAGLCVAAPRYRMNKAWFARVVPAALRAAHAIAREYGHRTPARRGIAAS